MPDAVPVTPTGPPPRSRVQARSGRRVLDAARELVEQDGLDQLSMRRLAAAAEVSVRTIYNVFGDRDGVVTALVLESFEAMEAAVERLEAADPLERIWEAVTITVESNCRDVPRAVVAAVVADPRLYRHLGSRWRGTALIVDAIDTAMQAGMFRDDLPAARLAEQAGTVFFHGLGRWSAGEIDEPELLATALYAFDVCLLAVAKPKARGRLLAHATALEPGLPAPASERRTTSSDLAPTNEER